MKPSHDLCSVVKFLCEVSPHIMSKEFCLTRYTALMFLYPKFYHFPIPSMQMNTGINQIMNKANNCMDHFDVEMFADWKSFNS